ncbi:MAG TPA: hypothetical protein VKB86_16025 [Pyrinomonadaceae bacterium]|nr:hypothetical protein [Pyrinomonadaceae bacterium]
MTKTDYSTNGIISSETRAALVIAHPGHELSIYGWLKSARPLVFILTDGSGHSGNARIERTTRIIKEVGARTGSFYGRYSDAALYEALLNHRFDLFARLADELAAQIINGMIECVVGDARDGYNPAHDVCRLVVDTAVEIAVRATGRKIDNLQFRVASQPDALLQTSLAESVCLHLDQAMLDQKLAAARNYPELKSEVDAFLNTHSVESLRTEYLYRAGRDNGEHTAGEVVAYYEQHGEERVEQGYYSEVIRYREHILPLAIALRRNLEEMGDEQIACSDYDL